MSARPSGTPTVRFVVRYMNHYREPFYRGLAETLTERGVDFEMIHGDPSPSEATKRDSVTPGWSTRIPNRIIRIRGRELVVQPLYRRLRNSDLVIVEQASRLTLNYLLAAARIIGRGPLLANIGHGANLASSPNRLGEAVKRRAAGAVDWFFAYTVGTQSLLEDAGFPVERITVFQNTIDTGELRQQLDDLTPEEVGAYRSELGIDDHPLILTLGSLYPDKRPDLAIDTVRLLQDEDLPPHLLLIGSGELEDSIIAAASRTPWLHHAPATFGRGKALALASADALLIPGVAGLVVIDGLAAGLPIVTADNPHHPPEIAYVEHGVHGLIADRPDAELLASTLRRLLCDHDLSSSLSAKARERGSDLTVSTMIERFADGVMAALEAGPRRARPDR